MTLDNTGRKTVSGLQEIERRRGYVHTESLVRQGRKLRLNFSQTFDMRPLNYLFFSFHSTKNATSTDPQKIKRDIKKCVLYVVYDMDLSSKIWSPRRYETQHYLSHISKLISVSGLRPAMLRVYHVHVRYMSATLICLTITNAEWIGSSLDATYKSQSYINPNVLTCRKIKEPMSLQNSELTFLPLFEVKLLGK